MKGKWLIIQGKIKKLIPKRKPSIIEYVSVILCLVMLLSTVTYSWIKRSWTPQIGQDGIKIVAGESLVFSLIGREYGVTTTLTLWEADEDGVELAPVSNYSGKSEDFFKVDSSNQYKETFEHLYPSGTITNSSWTQLGEDNGYIEMSFVIQGRDIQEVGSDYTKYVFLSTNSRISASSNNTDEQKNVYKAIRCSISFDSTTILFVPTVSGVKRTHKGINNETVIEGEKTVWTADGAAFTGTEGDDGVKWDSVSGRFRNTYYTYKSTRKTLVLSNAIVYTFQEKMGGYTSTGGNFDSSKALFSLTPGDQKTVTVRIWLEGEDEECKEAIKGSQIDFLLGFESENVVNGTPGGEESAGKDD